MTAKPRFDGEWVRLGELIDKAKIRRCGTDAYPVLSMTMHDGIVEQRNRFKKAIASKDTSSYKVVNPGQLVVGFPIDEGVIYVQKYPFPGIMSPAYNIWDIDISKVDPPYLELALHSPRSMAYYADKMRGTTARRRSIAADSLCALEIPLPPLSVQREVVALFQGIEKAKSSSELTAVKLDTLVKSRFVEMFGGLEGYKSVPLEKCVERVESGKSPKCLSVARADGAPAVLKLSSISSGVYRESENKALPSDVDLDIGKVVREGDILLARKNTPELVGRSVLVKQTGGGVMFPDIVFRMHPVSDVDGFYLAHLLAGPLFGSIRSLAHGSAKSMSNIPKSELAKLLIPLPPLSLQQEFASFVAQVDKSRFVVQQQIEKLQMLYDSLAQEYFS